ncbi:odorant receptor 85b [Dendroctonus ponderosae]|uniref:Odorant receptor n=3 Tax=Dendroctonus ponderosae TaxID=77166 RepID=A0AAR5PNC7_DENPD|nr:odorant receptor 85b [Dendroctonus ponderosae]
MLKEYSIHPMLHLIGYAMAVFLVCQNGQKIRDQTYDIQDAVYKARWYDNITSTTKDSQLIMLRCQKPLCMDAIPFGIFNFSLLLVIIKTSYSYLTLINKTS